MHQLAGKTALITGASRGIGAATAQELSNKGVNVVLAARGNLDDVMATLDGPGKAITCDVSRYEDTAAAVALCQEAFGTIDILVNNAGVIDPIAHLADSDPKAWDQVIDINAKGVYHAIRAALPPMLSQGAGIIVNISSGAATNPMEGWSHYCASKAAVLSLTHCVHKEYADRGIRIVGLSPGTVATDMQVKIKKSGINPVSQLDFSAHIPPEWPARAITYLCTTPAFDGDDFSLKTEQNRRLVGLIA